MPYGREGEEKVEVVEEMFDNIAPNYDRLNHIMSFDIDKGWRRSAIKELEPHHPRRVLDIATGTGDFAILAAKRLKPEKITAVDISDGMMNMARLKADDEGVGGIIDFQREDCTRMSFGDGTFDAVISAFGIRNFQDLDKGLAEMCRVLKPGGHLCVVELAAPVKFPMKQLFHIYAHVVLPLWGKIISHDKRAYEYLPRTIEAFPQGERMVGILKKAGFARASFRRLTCGICTMYTAEK